MNRSLESAAINHLLETIIQDAPEDWKQFFILPKLSKDLADASSAVLATVANMDSNEEETQRLVEEANEAHKKALDVIYDFCNTHGISLATQFHMSNRKKAWEDILG